MDLSKKVREIIDPKGLQYLLSFNTKFSYYILNICRYSIILSDCIGVVLYENEYNKNGDVVGYKAITIDNLPSDIQNIVREITKILKVK